MYKHKIKVEGLKEFEIWQENGMVKQNGLSLPEVLTAFGNNKQGREQAGAYIAGMLKMQELINK